MTSGGVRLLGAGELRELAERLAVRPSKSRGQNFVHDANTVRRIVAAARLEADEVVLEVGPGLGSLTLGLLAAGVRVTAVEIEPAFAAELGRTATSHGAPAGLLQVLHDDALRLPQLTDPSPTALVANLPYNIAVPVVLRLLAGQPTLRHGLVMVQAEVADRLAAPPGTRSYGVPSVKAAWFARAERAGAVSRAVFWPVPGVDSALVRLTRHPPPAHGVDWPGPAVTREQVFTVVDAAFAQRRKALRGALAGVAGSAAVAAAALQLAGVDPLRRGETLDVHAFARLTSALVELGAAPAGRPRRPPDPGN